MIFFYFLTFFVLGFFARLGSICCDRFMGKIYSKLQKNKISYDDLKVREEGDFNE